MGRISRRIARRMESMFLDSYTLNQMTYDYFYNRLKSIAISRFDYQKLPPEIDERFLELTLYEFGFAVFYKDEIADAYVALTTAIGGELTIYNIPTYRRAYATNGYNYERNASNSVLIYDNYLHRTIVGDIDLFARRLTNIQRAIDVNVDVQKTPFLIRCKDAQKETYRNIYKKISGNENLIQGYDGLNMDGIDVVNLNPPSVFPDLQNQLVNVWNDAMSYLGISNVSIQKRERLVSDEVTRAMGGTVMSRNSPLKMRQECIKKVNEMFGLDIEVNFATDIDLTMTQYAPEEIKGMITPGGEVNE